VDLNLPVDALTWAMITQLRPDQMLVVTLNAQNESAQRCYIGACAAGSAFVRGMRFYSGAPVTSLIIRARIDEPSAWTRCIKCNHQWEDHARR